MTSSPHGPYALGYTRVTMPATAGREAVRRSKSLKSRPSSDRGLQPALVKLDSVVIADQHPAVNMPLLLAHTARQTIRVEFR